MAVFDDMVDFKVPDFTVVVPARYGSTHCLILPGNRWSLTYGAVLAKATPAEWSWQQTIAVFVMPCCPTAPK